MTHLKSSFLVGTSSTQLLSCHKVSNGHLSVLPVESSSARMFTPYHITSTLLRIWQVEDLAELADGPTGCGKVARGECLFAWNFRVTRSTLLAERDIRPNTTLSLH